jgi:uncharacterized membrane protein YcaP (DUF421 family)
MVLHRTCRDRARSCSLHAGRRAGVISGPEIRWAVLERDGHISIVPKQGLRERDRP